ncbi:MAG: adaptor protein MecA [Clostridia bacterium]|nr:adaptor protein MecA [Oscillospiraceae bacterium]MBR2411063.1 adaptor protein MecA [Clostridia bacterium]
MNIIFRNEYRVEAEITDEELDSFGVTYEELDYGNIETRRVLRNIAEKIRMLSGAEINFSGRLLIEVIKERSDLFRICFSRLSNKNGDDKSVKQLVKSENEPVVAEFSDIEDVLLSLPLFERDTLSSLYEKNGKYRLIAYLPGEKKERLLLRISEFSEVMPEGLTEKARCEELWSCIIEGSALSKLNEVF